jgi:type VI secretion system protein ImpK
MAEESKRPFDPDATVSQPAGANAGPDPEATISQPLDPEATITQPLPLDPEATFTGARAKGDDPEATDRRPAFDPDATDRRPAFDPEATVRAAGERLKKKHKPNPFAPKSPPETIQANLSSLGGINTLVAMANPILAAVPQIRRTLKHPDPAGLKASLKDQIEALEMSAVSAEIDDDSISAAIYALCALLDESAAATPWGGSWMENGLLQEIRGEGGAGEGFYKQLDKLAEDPDKNADLLEFLYICLALGFEGRYRGAENRPALEQAKARLYALVSKRRPRPEALSENWRTPAAQAIVDAALQTAARANAARAAAEAAARDAEATLPPRSAKRGLARLPRRAIWSAVLGIVGAAIVFYMLALRLLDENDRTAMAGKPAARAKPGASAAAPAAEPASAALAKALDGLPVAVADSAAGVTISLQEPRQFAPGGNVPSAPTRAALARIAEVLDKQLGTIVVVGHADATPAGSRYASNADLSVSRARYAAQAMMGKLADPKRIVVEGRGDAEPIAANDTDENRAKNRRVSILVKP